MMQSLAYTWSWYHFHGTIVTLLILNCVSQCPCLTLFPSVMEMSEDEGFDPEEFHGQGSQVPEDFVHKRVYAAFEQYNRELVYYNHEEAMFAWNISTHMTQQSLDENEKFTISKNNWSNHWCSELMKVYHDPEFGHFQYPWDMSHQRQLYLMCRGPRFSSYQLSNVVTVLGNLQQLYNKQVCISSIGKCMRMEPDLNHFMEWARDEAQLRDAWIAWHGTIGREVKPLYAGLIRMLNQGAKQAGFTDMGQCWRDEMEIEDLQSVVLRLYSDVKYLYTLLHAFVRHKLEAYYGLKFHNGLIPSHLLGNMWAQKWDSLMDIMLREDKKPVNSGDRNTKPLGSCVGSTLSSLSNCYLVNKILPPNATVLDMVKAAESFYVSMGLPHLPESFWEKSYFQDTTALEGTSNEQQTNKRQVNSRNCHGSAANMFDRSGDYRMLMCAQVNDEDLIIIHHEVGHIMYFMAYSKLPTVFQDGANTAFHESVGDSVTYDLIHSKQDENSDRIRSLLKTGLAKLPQIGFGLVMDMWRWKIFENPDKVSQWNDMWWQMNEEYLGITKPAPDYNVKGDGLDAAGKFHIVDNIPYIRYFFASFLQMQFYEAMCNAEWNNGDLHDCHIRGSKQAGKLLWNMMKQGTSRRWPEILNEMTGTSHIESRALLVYFEPLRIWLENEIGRQNISLVGW